MMVGGGVEVGKGVELDRWLDEDMRLDLIVLFFLFNAKMWQNAKSDY